MLGQLNLQGLDKVELAIKRIQTFEPQEGYFLAFSGGKDSVVIKALADMAGVKYDAHYNITTVDPPELVRFIKNQHPDVSIDVPRDKDGNRVTMWNLIPKKKMPPTRIVRYCCEKLKEESGAGRFVITGVRWAESARRKNSRGGLEIEASQGKRTLADPDNPENEQLARFCPTRGSHVLNPIIDWTDEDVWEFIRKYNVPYCKLYDEGFKRLGCIGCPISTNAAKELERYPTIKRAYLRAFGEMIKARQAAGLDCQWKTPEEVMVWWLNGKSTSSKAVTIEWCKK